MDILEIAVIILSLAVIVVGISVPVSLFIFAKKLGEMSGSADAVREVSTTFIEAIRGQGEISRSEVEARLAQNHIVGAQTKVIEGLVNAVEALCNGAQEHNRIASAERREVLAEIRELRRERSGGNAQRGLR